MKDLNRDSRFYTKKKTNHHRSFKMPSHFLASKISLTQLKDQTNSTLGPTRTRTISCISLMELISHKLRRSRWRRERWRFHTAIRGSYQILSMILRTKKRFLNWQRTNHV